MPDKEAEKGLADSELAAPPDAATSTADDVYGQPPHGQDANAILEAESRNFVAQLATGSPWKRPAGAQIQMARQKPSEQQEIFRTPRRASESSPCINLITPMKPGKDAEKTPVVLDLLTPSPKRAKPLGKAKAKAAARRKPAACAKEALKSKAKIKAESRALQLPCSSQSPMKRPASANPKKRPSMAVQKDPDYTVVLTNTTFGSKQSYMQCKMASGRKRLLVSSCAAKHEAIIRSLRKFGEQLTKNNSVSNALEWEHVRSVMRDRRNNL